ncbi:MAG: hypothetical protein NTX66_00225, partial [Candidatus Falkowbacteria bacterium]|nr:hypothetical protein [Candidatus Falkowbacteria bacterium]
DGEAHEYIKIIYSNRRLANKLRLALEPVRVFEACFIGIFPYYDTFFPGKIRPRNKRKNRRPLNPASKKDL